MAVFLNTKKISYWLNRLIRESEKEVILIVPYIKTSKDVFNSLKFADHNQIQITIIYREDKLTLEEKSKISQLKNLNLLHHPNVHCKCFFNGKMLILSSMNLYEYSEKNNREMGTLFHLEELEELEYNGSDSTDSTEVFTDAIFEIKEIVNGAKLEKLSPIFSNQEFNIEIIKTAEEHSFEIAQRLNKYFLNKKFKPFEINKETWYVLCKNYYDKVDIYFEGHRVSIEINLPEDELEKIHKIWMKSYEEFEFRGFKYYWNYHKSSIYLYKNNNFDWDSITDEKIYYKKIRQGLDSIVNKYIRIAKLI